ncbi:MAG: 50S ribosomal protein L1 [Deltaproteobacteria bacterium]|nr:50S ribosomal protein L1 [Deltaproteobacteria bacterium]
MAAPGKKFAEARAKVDREKKYSLDEALDLIEQTHYTKFDENVDLAVRLGVDPKHADQMVRGAIVLPHGIGKETRVLVFAKGEKEKEAADAGADFVGSDEYIKKVQEGWLEFDKVIATPDLMAQVGKLGKVLGPRGLMPNPKVGTVTFDVGRAVQEQKAGKVEFKVNKDGIVHAPAGKVSFGKDKLRENLLAILDIILKAKPASSKGNYLLGVTISNTMGPGVRLNTNEIQAVFKK